MPLYNNSYLDAGTLVDAEVVIAASKQADRTTDAGCFQQEMVAYANLVFRRAFANPGMALAHTSICNAVPRSVNPDSTAQFSRTAPVCSKIEKGTVSALEVMERQGTCSALQDGYFIHNVPVLALPNNRPLAIDPSFNAPPPSRNRAPLESRDGKCLAHLYAQYDPDFVPFLHTYSYMLRHLTAEEFSKDCIVAPTIFYKGAQHGLRNNGIVLDGPFAGWAVHSLGIHILLRAMGLEKEKQNMIRVARRKLQSMLPNLFPVRNLDPAACSVITVLVREAEFEQKTGNSTQSVLERLNQVCKRFHEQPEQMTV